MDAKSPHSNALATLLGVFEVELAELASASLDFQADLSAELPSIPARLPFSAALQSIDLITQRLEGLHRVLAILIPLIPQEWRLDAGPAIDAVTLSTLARRLNGTSQVQDAGESGLFELF